MTSVTLRRSPMPSLSGLAMGLGTGLALGALIVGAALAFRDVMPAGAALPETLPMRVGGSILDAPADLARAPGSGLSHGTLTLALPHPAANLPAGEPSLILRIAASDGGMDPADRPAQLYARFLTSDVWRNPGGLLSRRFRAGSPYQTEELYLAPPDGRAFAARCPRMDRPDAVAGLCIAEFREDGLDVTMSFPARRLPEWAAMDRQARTFLASIRRPGPVSPGRSPGSPS